MTAVSTLSLAIAKFWRTRLSDGFAISAFSKYNTALPI